MKIFVEISSFLEYPRRVSKRPIETFINSTIHRNETLRGIWRRGEESVSIKISSVKLLTEMFEES